MAYDMEKAAANSSHSLGLENRSVLTLTGVEDVESFDENEIIMNTSQGNLIVRGSSLHIGKISLDVGEMQVAGLINELCYEETAPAGGFWSRLFK